MLAVACQNGHIPGQQFYGSAIRLFTGRLSLNAVCQQGAVIVRAE
jgi:hypothetical protein